jgi:hypothetical protein
MVRVAKTVAGVGVLFGCAALWLVPVAGAATLQNNFASRETVKAAPLTATGSNVGAGREAGEPVPTALSPAGHTVWLGWEAPSSAYFTFSTCASSISTVIAFYVGSEVNNLSEEQSQASFVGPECSGIRDGITSLFLTGGKVQIMVDGNSFHPATEPPPVTEGPLTLQIEKTPPPPNDNFANAAPLTGQITEEPNGTRSYFGDQSGYNYNATKETGEPKHDGDQGGASVWYTWTAPESGVARFGLCCGATTLLGVYTGNAVNALTPVGSGKGSVEVPVTAGVTYRVAVDSEFQFFLGTPIDDKFDLTMAENLAPGPGFGGGGGAGDTTPPQTTLLRGKKSKKPTTRTFTYKSSEPKSTFRCRLDRQPFAPCGSSKTYKNLKPGKHKFEVFAIDAAGNKDSSPVVVHFTVPQKHKHHRR